GKERGPRSRPRTPLAAGPTTQIDDAPDRKPPQDALTSQVRLDHLRHALLGDGRADEVGDREHPLLRVLDGDAVVGPLEQLDVVLAVAEGNRLRCGEAEALGEEREPRALR